MSLKAWVINRLFAAEVALAGFLGFTPSHFDFLRSLRSSHINHLIIFVIFIKYIETLAATSNSVPITLGGSLFAGALFTKAA